MKNKSFSILKRSIFVWTIFFGALIYTDIANAAQNLFFMAPGTGLNSSLWPIQDSPAKDPTQTYARNAYWNFATNPFVTLPCASNCNPDAQYYGTKDSSLYGTNKNLDSFVQGSSGTVNWAAGHLSIGSNKNASAIFNFNATGLANTASMLYLWAETTVITNASGSYVSFSNLAGTGSSVTASEIFLNGSSTPIGGSSPVSALNYQMSGSGAGSIYDAYFAISNPNNSEALTLSFHSVPGGSAEITGLQIAMTPEPITMALFATGVGVLFFFRRRLGLGFAIA